MLKAPFAEDQYFCKLGRICEEYGAALVLRPMPSEALQRGAEDAPAFFVGAEMFWGNDRLHFFEAALQG